MERQAQAIQEAESINTCTECNQGALFTNTCTECNQGALFTNTGACSTCLQEHYHECNECGIMVHNPECFYYLSSEDGIWLNDGKNEGFYCEECFPKYGFICADCGVIEAKGKYKTVNDYGNEICNSCAEHYYHCDNCGCIIHEDNLHCPDDTCYCEECYANAIENIDIELDIPEYREAQRMSMAKREEFQGFRNSWREEFIPCVAEFYAIQLMKELNRRPDGLNMVDLAPMDALTGEYKINIYASIYHAINMNAVDELHCSPYWEGFMDKNDTREAQIIHDLKKFFMDYIFIACVGEARHVYNCSAHDGFIPEWLPVDTKKEYCSREDLWSYGYYLLELCKTNPSQYNFESFCKDLYRVFDENEWHSSYGGAKWANIIGHLCRYLNGEMQDLNFVDLSISLVHNGSLFVDKIGVSVPKLKRLLDLKFAAQIKDILEVIGYIKTEYIMYRYEEAYKFASAILEINKIEEKPITEVQAKAPDYIDIMKHCVMLLKNGKVSQKRQEKAVSYEELPKEVQQELESSMHIESLIQLKASGFMSQCYCTLCAEVKQAIVKTHDSLPLLHVDHGCSYPNHDCSKCYSISCGGHASLAFVIYKQVTGIDGGKHENHLIVHSPETHKKIA